MPASEAEKAFLLKQQGKSLAYIADNTAFGDVARAQSAIKSYMISLGGYAKAEIREEQLTMELSRIDAVQDHMWPILQFGEAKDAIAAAKTILQAVKQRSELVGLTQVDPTQQNTIAFVVSGSEADYIKTLQATINE